MIGVIGWSLFAKSLTGTTKTLTSNSGLFQFTKIPKSVFAVSGMLTNYVLSFISLFALVPFLIYYGIEVNTSIIMVPFCLIALGLVGTSIGSSLLHLQSVFQTWSILFNSLLELVSFSHSHVDISHVIGKFGSGSAFVLAHLNPVIVPITMMRDFILGSTSGIPDYGFAMFGGLFFLTFT